MKKMSDTLAFGTEEKVLNDRPLFTLENFEGPLDLLLHLIRENKLNILEIQISELLSQYMDYLERVKEQDLEIAVEFVEMASRLVRIKTNLMLPRQVEEGEESLGRLTEELIEYSLCKQLAELLRDRSDGLKRRVREPMTLPAIKKIYENIHDPSELSSAYFAATKRGKNKQPPPRDAFDGIVKRPFVSVTSRVIVILKNLIKKGKLPLSSLYGEAEGRSQLVATFLAVLELVKTKRIAVSDDGEEVTMLKKEKTQERSAEDGH